MNERWWWVKFGPAAIMALQWLLLLPLAGFAGAARAEAAGQVMDRPAATEVAAAEVLDPSYWRPSYHPGRGLRFGDSGLVLGGYSSIELIRDEGGPGELVVDDLSFFVMLQGFERFAFFSELEFEKPLTIDTDGNIGSPGNRFEIERLFLDVNLGDTLRVRGGKFLTPVGRWNVIHAQPLVWTTSRPLTTEIPFDENTTGLALMGELFETGVEYEVFGQFTNQLDESSPQATEADRSGGLRLVVEPLSGLSIGSTYTAFRSDDEWFHLGGVDALWRHGRFEWMSELTFDDGAGGSGSQWGVYTQLVGEIVPRLYGVARYEHFAPRGSTDSLNQVVLGGAFRPWPFGILKIEYQIVDHRSPLATGGFRSSFAILF